MPCKVKERKDAHKLIEDFMLLANRKVAEFVSKKGRGKKKYTFVYRAHDAPNPETLGNFAQFAARFGYRINMKSEPVGSQATLSGEQDPNTRPILRIWHNIKDRTWDIGRSKRTNIQLTRYKTGFLVQSGILNALHYRCSFVYPNPSCLHHSFVFRENGFLSPNVTISEHQNRNWRKAKTKCSTACKTPPVPKILCQWPSRQR